MKKERVRSKHGFKGFGVFVLGWFIGFISTLGILFGVGYWAYTSITVKRIEKWTKSDITDNQGIEDLTLRKAIGIIQGITSNNSDAYTLAKMEEDFGVSLFGNSIYGISTDVIKNSPIKDLDKAIDETIDTATFNNVLNFLGVEQSSLGLLDTILESKFTYYVYEGKLYTTDEHNIEVGFDYKIEDNVVKFGNGTHTISSNKISPRLSDLPLNTAMTSIEDATKDLKMYEVMNYTRELDGNGNYIYKDGKVEVTGIMKSLAEYTVGDLSKDETFNDIYIYEVMNYKRTGTAPNYTYEKNGEKITGTMKALAGKTVGKLSDPETINGLYLYEIMGYTPTGDGNYSYIDENNQEQQVTGAMKALAGKTIKQISDPDTINNLQVYEVMGYTRTEEEGVYTYMNGGKEVTGFMKAIAGTTINQIDNTIETLKAVDLFDKEDTVILKLFTDEELKTLTIMDLPNDVTEKINTTKIEDLVNRQIITGVNTGTEYYASIKGLTLVELLNGSVS